MYKQILALHLMCRDRQIPHTLENLYDGYKMQFPDGADIVQHLGSYEARGVALNPWALG